MLQLWKDPPVPALRQARGFRRAGDREGIPQFLAVENFLDLGNPSPFLSASRLGVREWRERRPTPALGPALPRGLWVSRGSGCPPGVGHVPDL